MMSRGAVRRQRTRPSRTTLWLAIGTSAVCLGAPYSARALVPVAYVSNCDDSGAGSLRQALLDVADPGTIDAHTQLVGVCSSIVVQSAQLQFGGDNLTIVGPGQDQLTITTAHRAGSIILHYPNRIFSHTGRGTLTFQNLSIQAGNVTSTSGSIGGGCIQSSQNVKLISATVSGCSVTSNAQAYGGGIAAAGNVYLLESSVIASQASGTDDGALGGGIRAASVTSRQSTVADNTAFGGSGSSSVVNGGGIDAGALDIATSTISGNAATGGLVTHYNVQSSAGGGIYSRGAIAISDSTVSGNTAGYYAGADINATTVTIVNSTFAFNHSDRSAGVSLRASTTLTIDSNIFSNNTSGAASVANDLMIFGTVAPAGTHNLVFASNAALPSGTSTGKCPLLAPLADNGGSTLTHALYSGSPAIDAGDNSQSLPLDQRGSARTSGEATDIGSFEVDQADEVFGGGFDGC